MGFISDEQQKRFLEICSEIEKIIVSAGIILIKIFPERPRRYRYGAW